MTIVYFSSVDFSACRKNCIIHTIICQHALAVLNYYIDLILYFATTLKLNEFVFSTIDFQRLLEHILLIKNITILFKEINADNFSLLVLEFHYCLCCSAYPKFIREKMSNSLPTPNSNRYYNILILVHYCLATILHFTEFIFIFKIPDCSI